jgi:Holliday junction resolvasome RuvABC DNA-binding subunit
MEWLDSAEAWGIFLLILVTIGFIFTPKKAEPYIESKRTNEFNWSGPYLDALDALVALGFKKIRAKERIKELAHNKQYTNAEDIIRDAFKS